MYTASDEMRLAKLKILKRNDKMIGSKYCNNKDNGEWIGDMFWNIIINYIYGV